MGEWSIEPGTAQPRAGSPRWWFTSRSTGRIVIVQAPNLALVVFALAWAAGRLLDSHHAATRILSDVASGAIVFWSLDELLRGVNPWRRALGAAVLAASLVSLWPR